MIIRTFFIILSSLIIRFALQWTRVKTSVMHFASNVFRRYNNNKQNKWCSNLSIWRSTIAVASHKRLYDMDCLPRDKRKSFKAFTCKRVKTTPFFFRWVDSCALMLYINKTGEKRMVFFSFSQENERIFWFLRGLETIIKIKQFF